MLGESYFDEEEGTQVEIQKKPKKNIAKKKAKK
jgi:hypothetical protein